MFVICLSVFNLSVFPQIYEDEIFATDTGSTPEPRPFFEDPDNNITSQLGSDVYMHCRVKDLLKEAKVSFKKKHKQQN